MMLMQLPIIEETEDWIALNKPAGLLSIPDREGKEVSLKAILQDKFGEIFTIHRLDRETSGVILFAKNAEAHRFFSHAFEERIVGKLYLGLVNGVLSEKKGTIDEPIGDHPSKRGLMAVVKKGKPSRTDYTVKEEFGKYSLVEFSIHTGRTHQIRVHMQSLGHPIVCDELYGDGKPVFISSIKKNFKLSKLEEEERPILNRLGLHALRLIFIDEKGKDYSLEAEIPKDMRALIQQLRKWK
jgi:23S rRNA pseudouridine955/2504/2580 synthase/23S rRNA pseudouridine1911/1915/1917 synthase